MPHFSTDTNGIKRLVTPPTGEAGTAVDGNFGTISSIITTLSGSITTLQTSGDPTALKKASNLSDLVSASTARTNLGLGSAATSNTSAFDAAGTTSTHAALTTTHGVSGNIVGTTSTQTLTNKTIDANNNTLVNLPSTPSQGSAGAIQYSDGSGNFVGATITTDGTNINMDGGNITNVNDATFVTIEATAALTNTPVVTLQNTTDTSATILSLKGGQSSHEYYLGVGNESDTGFSQPNKFFIYDITTQTTPLSLDSSGNLSINGQYHGDGSQLTGITAAQVGADASGAAASAQAACDPAGSAATAQSNAEAYALALGSNYDSNGAAASAASAAQSAAESFASSLSSNYDPAGTAAAGDAGLQSQIDALSARITALGG